jgi:hypothetical protein
MEKKKNITSCEVIKDNGQQTARDLKFANQWAQALLEGITEREPDGNMTSVNMREVLRKCSRACYDRSRYDEVIKEADLDDFLSRAHEIFGWTIDYDKAAGKLIVYENNTECICPLARACNGKVAQSLCTCSETELERIFSRAYGGKVVAKVLKGVLKGDGCCVYQVQLLKKI